ncbi:MAG: hypothetical protein WDN50_13015 [Bradyrhizobium sp.]
MTPIPGVVESDNFLVSVIALADNTEVLHFEAGSGQLLDRGFSGGMSAKTAMTVSVVSIGCSLAVSGIAFRVVEPEANVRLE